MLVARQTYYLQRDAQWRQSRNSSMGKTWALVPMVVLAMPHRSELALNSTGENPPVGGLWNRLSTAITSVTTQGAFTSNVSQGHPTAYLLHCYERDVCSCLNGASIARYICEALTEDGSQFDTICTHVLDQLESARRPLEIALGLRESCATKTDADIVKDMRKHKFPARLEILPLITKMYVRLGDLARVAPSVWTLRMAQSLVQLKLGDAIMHRISEVLKQKDARRLNLVRRALAFLLPKPTPQEMVTESILVELDYFAELSSDSKWHLIRGETLPLPEHVDFAKVAAVMARHEALLQFISQVVAIPELEGKSKLVGHIMNKAKLHLRAIETEGDVESRIRHDVYVELEQLPSVPENRKERIAAMIEDLLLTIADRHRQRITKLEFEDRRRSSLTELCGAELNQVPTPKVSNLSKTFSQSVWDLASATLSLKPGFGSRTIEANLEEEDAKKKALSATGKSTSLWDLSKLRNLTPRASLLNAQSQLRLASASLASQIGGAKNWWLSGKALVSPAEGRLNPNEMTQEDLLLYRQQQWMNFTAVADSIDIDRNGERLLDSLHGACLAQELYNIFKQGAREDQDELIAACLDVWGHQLVQLREALLAHTGVTRINTFAKPMDVPEAINRVMNHDYAVFRPQTSFLSHYGYTPDRGSLPSREDDSGTLALELCQSFMNYVLGDEVIYQSLVAVRDSLPVLEAIADLWETYFPSLSTLQSDR
eukprot:Blabericola_migrator_1__1977@NODE_153_length_12753_cov_114_743891_g134_i0_p2_GENE_NODE_153_length_12753_cov_114_743891_g134_i0NODE_153_length_12753_cov_114_743891_g134_i0_p2_ORF_typecomplete_len716_score76_64_NODE_153_length_12753_cov_114_743891_g134_i047686915